MDAQGRIRCGKHGEPWCPICSDEIRDNFGLTREQTVPTNLERWCKVRGLRGGYVREEMRATQPWRRENRW